MNDDARKKFNLIYTGLLTGTYEKSAGTGLLEMARLIDASTDKMSIKLFSQVLERNSAKASDLAKLDIAEEIIGKQGEIASGIAFIMFVKGDVPAARGRCDAAAELCSEAYSASPKNHSRAEELTKMCDEFRASEKKLLQMKMTSDIMEKLGLFSDKTGS